MRLRRGEVVQTLTGRSGRFLGWIDGRRVRVALDCHISVENFQTHGPAEITAVYRRQDIQRQEQSHA